jgi:hypothetical protein
MISPLVSVIWNARDKTAAMQANIAALSAQTHQNYELILVEDADAADSSRATFRAEAAADTRIRIVPRLTTSSGESLLAALRECRGDFIAICPTDGTFEADALELAIQAFKGHPHAGLVCGDNFLIDAHGRSLDNVDIVTLLLTSYRPFLPAALFRRKALEDVGLMREDWLLHAIELEVCTRLATDFGIHRMTDKFVRCSAPASQDDGLLKSAWSSMQDRLQLLSKIFSVEGFWDYNEALLLESKANQIAILWEQFRKLGQDDIERLAETELRSIATQYDLLLLRDHRVLRHLHRLFCTRSQGLGLLASPLQKILAYAGRRTTRASIHIPYQFWAATFGVGRWLKRKVMVSTLPLSEHHPAAPTRAEMFADLYAIAASYYEMRGQIDIALELWELAHPLKSVDIDSLASQALLRLPQATDEMIESFQRKWVSRHLKSPRAVTLKAPRPPHRKIRVGYHCAFMHGDTIRYMMKNVVRAHDRTRFEIYGYSHRFVPPDIKQAFDVMRDTSAKHAASTAEPMNGLPALSTEQFIDLVRRDEIDVFVELTGFSMGNRFAAMADRCAPVQVSFLNHTGSSQVPNVDYVLSDGIGTPESDQAHYSEKIYRLPSCFFCFDYRGSLSPPVAIDPPSVKNGFTTFGCFGYSGKLNKELIEIWAKLLLRVPHSVLHLQNPQMASYDRRRFISTQFRNLGIDCERLRLPNGVDRRTLLEVYNHIDISLDTWPYCGGNTIAESLWMGVPVVTLKGDRFSSRYGASLLAAAGCHDLVGRDADEYIEVAARLAGDLPRLTMLRRNLRQMSIEYGLGDSQRFARDLEAAYVAMLG